MIRWGRIIGLCLAVFCLLAPAANAAPLGKAVLAKCDPATGEAVFEGRQSAVRQTKMQMQFTLQAGAGQGEVAQGRRRRLRRVDHRAERLRQVHVREDRAGAAAGLELPDRGEFRWRNAKGRTLRSERSTSPVCRVPETRPDLVLRSVADDSAGYVAKVFNRGRTAAGPFDVAVHRRRRPAGQRAGGRAGARAVDRRLHARPRVQGRRGLGGGRRPRLRGGRVQRGERLARRLLLSLYARLHW